jgi:DNA-binding LacI/PurR family transcriptional regulator
VRDFLDTRRPFQEESYAVVRRMLALRQRPDAIFCVTDNVAVEAMHAIRDAGLRCPEDVAVGGFDDSASAARQRPSLTTVRDPYYEMGREAARQLLDQLDGTRNPGGCTLVPCPLIVRESCGASLRSAPV